MIRRFVLVSGAVVLAAVGCTSSSTSPAPSGSPSPVTVTLLTHDSFDVSKTVLKAFEDQTGITVKIVPVGDAGQLANRLILESGNPEGDLAFGIDNDQLADVLAKDVFTPYTSPSLTGVPAEFQLDPEHRVTPIDHGDVCVNDDLSAYTGTVPAPRTLDDLTDPRYQGQLVVENPATSSPGLAFLLATVAAYGDPGFEDYWGKLRDNDVTVVDGWERAYYGEFSGAGGGDGAHPLVVSYATDPAAEVFFADPPVSSAPIGVLTDTCYRQIEFAGILRGAQHEAAAQQVLDFMLSQQFQNDIPLRMFVYPVSTQSSVPAVFRKYAAVVKEPWSLPPDEVAANRADWVERWASVMGQ
jgi:thiamine transport system substrate-binding protein